MNKLFLAAAILFLCGMLISQVFTHIPLTGCVLWALPLCIFRLFFIFALQPKTVQHTLDDLGYLGLWLLSKSLFSSLSFLQVCLKRVSLPSCDNLWAVVQKPTPHFIGLVTTQMLELLCISVFIQLCPLSCIHKFPVYGSVPCPLTAIYPVYSSVLHKPLF